MARTSDELHTLYQNIYQKGKNEHFLKYRDGRVLSEAHERVLAWLAANEPAVGTLLDFGCGEADFLAHVPDGTRRVGVDFSEAAIANGKTRYPGLELECGTEAALEPWHGRVDVVTSFGTLEHMDDPRSSLERLFACARPGGLVIASCPSFLNVRGVIWMALVKLFDVPMSLSDRHFLTVQDFREMSAANGAELIGAFSTDLAVGQGAYFGRDMRKRLTNALRDAKLDNSRVEAAVAWFERNLPDFATGELSGAESVYLMRKRA